MEEKKKEKLRRLITAKPFENNDLKITLLVETDSTKILIDNEFINYFQRVRTHNKLTL